MYEGEYRQQIVRYFNIKDALDVAIESRQIAIALQPIVSAKTGDIVSFEALARWTHPTLGVVSPGSLFRWRKSSVPFMHWGWLCWRKHVSFE